jgi:hypothetical protein
MAGSNPGAGFVGVSVGPTGPSLTGPTGPISATTGPTGATKTGPTGAIQTGPTGAIQTGPTGAVITGPTGATSLTTGPTGAIQTGPTGPTGTLASNDVGQIKETVNALGSVTGPQTIDLVSGNVVTATPGSGTWSITGPTNGKSSTLTLILTNPGANITWAVPPKWPGGMVPTLTVAGVDIITLTSVDGGVTWYASLAQDVK